MTTFTIAGHAVELDADTVAQRLSRELPDPIREHFSVIGGRRFPPKQAIAVVTGIDRADFTTHQARRVLQRLGFPAARRTAPVPDTRPPKADRAPDALVEAMRPYIGQWVAVKGDEVLVGADSPTKVVAWLTEHGVTGEGLFRVPGSDADIFGAAPF